MRCLERDNVVPMVGTFNLTNRGSAPVTGGRGGKDYAGGKRRTKRFNRMLGKKCRGRLDIENWHTVDGAGFADCRTTVSRCRQRYRHFGWLTLVRMQKAEPYLPKQEGQNKDPGGKEGFRPHRRKYSP